MAVLAALENKLYVAFIWICLGIFFDFFDGFAARLLHVKSEVGKQLDSFADAITSGLAPGIVMMQLLYMSFTQQWDLNQSHSLFQALYKNPWILVGLFITMGAVYRLAVFNLDTRQENSFIGLPTPANAILITSLVLILYFDPENRVVPVIKSPLFLIGLSLVSAFLLNAPVALFSLKIKDWTYRANKKILLFLLLTAILVAVLGVSAIPLAIIVYVFMGNWKLEKN